MTDIAVTDAPAEQVLLRPVFAADQVLAQRRALGGRATERIGPGCEYVAHDSGFGAAASRRRRQLAKRGIFGCAACGELTPIAQLSFVRSDADPNTVLAVCQPCIDAHTGDPS